MLGILRQFLICDQHDMDLNSPGVQRSSNDEPISSIISFSAEDRYAFSRKPAIPPLHGLHCRSSRRLHESEPRYAERLNGPAVSGSHTLCRQHRKESFFRIKSSC